MRTVRPAGENEHGASRPPPTNPIYGHNGEYLGLAWHQFQHHHFATPAQTHSSHRSLLNATTLRQLIAKCSIGAGFPVSL
jgi:hypothetical protein